MTERTNGTGCGIMSWAIAALVGGAAFGMLMLMGGWSFLQAVFAGGIIFVVAGLFFVYAFCRPLPGPGEVRIGAAAEAAPTPAAAPAAPVAPAAAPPVAAAAASEPSPAAAVEPTPAPVADPAPAPVADPAPAPEPSPEPVAAVAAAAQAPELLTEARAGGPDDLKLIRGVGPKLEAMLHRMGVFHFDQIASWTEHEVAWVDDNLEGFRGRVSRDEWVAQARVLAAGGTTEFSRRSSEGEGA